ncbi:MAG: hypothetical protein IT373_06615 [Polyangiaceae bacterium]|nr:hypothetical protein [Polyangiaceae bacterium]
MSRNSSPASRASRGASRPGRLRPALLTGACVAVLGPAFFAACKSDETTVEGCPPELAGPGTDPTWVASAVPLSCAFLCGSCDEITTPYDCPAMHAWSEVPHAAACGCWDGSYPAPVTGSCSASEPVGEAVRKAGPRAQAQEWVLPDGHLLAPAGRYVPLDEPGLAGTFPMTLLRIPGTELWLSSDGGIADDALRLLDVAALAGNGDPKAAHVRFASPTSLYHGVAWLAPDTALASGGGDGYVYAFTVDTVGRTLARDTARDIDLGGPTPNSYGPARWYSGPIAVMQGGTSLAVAPSIAAHEVLVRSLEAATWGQSLGTIPIGSQSVFELAADPFDPTGATLYATYWDGHLLAELDAVGLAVTRTLDVGKNPEGLVVLSPTVLVVASHDLDRLSVVDRAAWEVTSSVDLVGAGEPFGHGPSSLAFDPATSRLYATLSGVNAVAVFDVVFAGTTATLTSAGRIPTAWWPTDVDVRDDGSLVILAGKGTGTGPDLGSYTFGQGPIVRLMHGGVQHVPAPSAADLGAMSAVAKEALELADTPGYPTVSCPGGADDFPVPASPAAGPSQKIQLVLFIVRENKTYDAEFGDLPGTDGDPALVLAPGEMATLLPNSRKIAQTFTNFDNYYSDAEQSIQGHIWTAFGRTTDFVERSWLTAWGRGTRAPMAGVSAQGTPEEGSLFHALDRAGVPYANMGEMVGIGASGLDARFPGLVITISKPDIEKACYIAALARAECSLPPFVYAVLPNDHTVGGQALSANPGVMVAVNDEATGRVIDALSHSPLWQDTLVIVTEDDPQDGADHVEVHRTPFFMASPWVKRGYVSHGHYDAASIHKLVLTVLGVPYPNAEIAEAPLPLDAFTSTPDYTPYDYEPRSYDAPCNPSGSGAALAAEAWDFTEVDEQPGISYWVWRILHDKSFD